LFLAVVAVGFPSVRLARVEGVTDDRRRFVGRNGGYSIVFT